MIIYILLSILSGVLFFLSFLPLTLNWLIWFAFIPLFYCLKNNSFKVNIYLLFISGNIFYSLAFFWVKNFHKYGLPFVSIGSTIIFFMTPLLIIKLFIEKNKFNYLLIPSIWIFFEWLKQEWFLKLPFGILGYTQYKYTTLIQFADITGVLGISWLILFINYVLFKIIYQIMNKPFNSKKLYVSLTILASLFLVILVYGVYRADNYDNEYHNLKVGFVQTLYPPKSVWDENIEENLEMMLNKIKSLSSVGANLILFPESSVDRFITLDPKLRIDKNAYILNSISKMAKENESHIITGCLETKLDQNKIKKYNTLLHFNKLGNIEGVNRKKILVPFGEYYPFNSLFPKFYQYILNTTDALYFDIDSNLNLFKINDPLDNRINIGTIICFESGYSKLFNNYINQKVDFFINFTNDYWSLSKVSMIQHASFSVFRAIETRRPVLRISNGGLSGYINPHGKIYSKILLGKEGLMTSKVNKVNKEYKTFYSQHSNLILLFSIITIVYYIIYLLFEPIIKKFVLKIVKLINFRIK